MLTNAKRGYANTLIIFAALIMFFSGFAFGQTETGQIIGKVTDPTGAVVSGAQVTVKSVDTGATRQATSNQEGVYTISNLQPGLYDVSINASGFAALTRRVQVTIGSQTSVETALSVSAVVGEAEVVEASGGVEVNTQNQELSDVVSGTQIRELPTLTRNPYDLVALSGNVAPAGSEQGFSTTRGAGFAINGQRPTSTNIQLDGADNNNVFSATVGQAVPLDSVQEFRVLTSNFSAEYGRAAGGVINVATRAGSNDFHGSAYEFYRGASLTSNSFDNNANGIAKGNFVRNQFGYSLGGRLIRDKLFFFSSTEWTRVRSNESVINYVPTPQLIAASNAATQSFFNAFPLSNVSTGNVLTVRQTIAALGGVNSTTGAYTGDFASPGNRFASLSPDLPAFTQVRYNVPNDIGGGLPQNTYQTVNRVDWNISDRTQVYGRYALESNDFFQGTNSSSPYSGFNTGVNVFNNNFLLSATHTFSPNFVSQSKIVFNRLNENQPLGQGPVSPTLYFFSNTAAQLQGRNIALPGYLPFNPGSAIPFGGPQNLLQVYQDFNSTLGKHQFRYGGSYIYIRDNRTFGAYQTAVETLGSSYAQALSNLVGGNLRQFQVAVDPQGGFPGQTVNLPVSSPNFSRSNRSHEFALYVNDNWRVHQRVNVNLGLRYDLFGTPHNKNPRLDSNFYFGQGANIYEQIRNGRVQIAEDSPIGQLWRSDKNNFGPRIGVAWDVFGDGKTSLRGGYGISYERNFNNVTFNVIQNPPNYAVVSLIAPTDIASLPITSANFGPLAGGGGITSARLPITSLRAVDPNIRTAYAHFWSASLEREIFPNTVASIQYSGSAGRDLYTISNINRPFSGPVYLGSTTTTPTGGVSQNLNGTYSGINFRTNGGRSNYNGLIAEIANSRFRNLGLQFTARYTFSKALDNLSSTFSESSNNFNLGLLDPFNPNLDYGPADFDVRHRFAASFNWEVPYFQNLTGPMNLLLAGWEVTGIFTANTGTPFTVFDCTNGTTVCMRAQLNGTVKTSGSDNPTAVTGTPNRFVYIDLSNLSPSTYVNSASGNSDFGPFPTNMSGRNAFRGPGTWNANMGFYKRFRITEKYGLQFRGEFYNIFNHPNLFIERAETDLSGATYIPAFRDGRRNIQLALKFTF